MLSRLFFRIRFFYIGAANEIIHADTVKICQLVQNNYRDIQISQLIIRISCLVDL